MSILKRKSALPPMPEASRFDRFDEEAIYLLIEQAFSTAAEAFRQAHHATDENVVHALHLCDTALSDAQAGVRSVLRRRLAIARNL